ncbi:hypothetical protein [Thiorhodospira sibirica]|uniref:hypothetical protein n=1 Tax=Thiorhodospira sibirica TaxID=154347 RepID=UPI00022C04BD|nr:hypothetical protein [Thiorhodospira sibirica]
MMLNYLLAILFIFAAFALWVLVDQLARRIACKHPHDSTDLPPKAGGCLGCQQRCRSSAD